MGVEISKNVKSSWWRSDVDGFMSRLISLACHLLCRRPSALEARIRRASIGPTTSPPPIGYVRQAALKVFFDFSCALGHSQAFQFCTKIHTKSNHPFVCQNFVTATFSFCASIVSVFLFICGTLFFLLWCKHLKCLTCWCRKLVIWLKMKYKR